MKALYGVEWIIGTRRPQLRTRVVAALSVIVCTVFTWSILVNTFAGLRTVVPDPLSLTYEVYAHLHTKQFWLDVGTSTIRVWTGMFFGFVIGFPAALILASYPKTRMVAVWYLGITRSFPRYTLLFILMAGMGVFSEGPKFLLSWWAVFSTQITLVYFEAVRLLDSEDSHIEILPLLGIEKRSQLLRVLAPLLLPQSFTGLYLASASAWAVLVISEAAVSTAMPHGIGYRINAYFLSDNMSSLFEYSVLLVMCIMFTWFILWVIKKYTLRWQGT